MASCGAVRTALALGISVTGLSAWAAPALPYSTRTSGYTAWSPYPLGSLGTLGMAGATVGLAHTPDGTFQNPAGLAMTYGGTDLGVTGYTLNDTRLDNTSAGASAVVASSQLYPWGFGVSLTPVHMEAVDANVAGTDRRLENSTREIHISAARVLDDHSWSFGVSLVVLASVRSLQTVSHVPTVTTAEFGVLKQLPNRHFLGATLVPGVTLASGLDTSTASTIDGFFQPAYSPTRLSAGWGWIPNRFLQAGISLEGVSGHGGAALLLDQSVPVGNAISFHPRAGARYVFAEFKEFRGAIALGSWIEWPRIQGTSLRPHLNAALEVNPWILYFGAGVDLSAGASQIIYSSGVDVLRLFEKLDLIPPTPRPLQAGLFPEPFESSDWGLPRPIVKEWSPAQRTMDLLKAGRDLPRKIQEKIQQAPQTLKNISEGAVESVRGAVTPEDPRPKVAPKTKP